MGINYNMYLHLQTFLREFLLFIISICLLVCWPTSSMQAQQDTLFVANYGSEEDIASPGLAKLSGTIMDTDGVLPLFGVELFIRRIQQKVRTDTKGYFEMAVPTGKHLLEISGKGYLKKRVQLNIYQDGILNLNLLPEDYQLEEVLILDQGAESKVAEKTVGLERMSVKQMERKALLMGETDVLRSIQTISGVSSVGDGASGFNVRGGNTDENLILQDQGLVFNPTHALGFFSLFHPDLVSGVELYKGGLPSKYGGRLSSVLDVKLRRGNTEQFKARGGVGMASSRLSFEGPIKKNRSSFLVGARASYIDWMLRAINDADLQKSDAFFYDVTAKVDGFIGQNTQAGISVFNSFDDFTFADEAKIDYETRSATAYVNHILGEKASLSFNLNAGQYISSLFDLKGTNQSEFDIDINYYRSRLNALIRFSENQNLNVGVEGNLYDVTPGTIEPVGEISSIQPQTLDKERGLELSIYAEQNMTFGEVFDLTVGLRFTSYRNIGPGTVYLYPEDRPKDFAVVTDSLVFGSGETIASYSGLEPRVSFKWNLSSNGALKGGYYKAFQYISQISNTAAAAPIDIWQLANYHIGPQEADNFSLGYFHEFPDRGLEASFNVFYRDIKQLIEYKDFAELILNNHLETELLRGNGRTYGAEFYFNKRKGRHQIETNYTFSRALRKVEASETQVGINAGEWFPSNYDKPHNFNITYFFQTRKNNNFSVNFTYSTGRPITAPVSNYTNDNLLNIPVYSDRNKFRIPDYHRLDIAYTATFKQKKETDDKHAITLSVYNLYARKNAYSVFFRQSPFQAIQAFRLAVLGTMFPSITYNFQF